MQSVFSKTTYGYLLAILFLFAVLLNGCQTRSRTTPTPPSGIIHIVLVWTKPPLKNRQKIINATKKLKNIAFVESLVVGPVLPSQRKIVDSSFDIGIVMRFKNKQSMNAYLKHPLHKQTVKNIIRPLTRKILVYDFKIH